MPAVAEQFVIDHVGHRGDGVVLTGRGAIYIPYSLPGERIETESDTAHSDRPRLRSVIEASPERIDPFCEYFGSCGGCAIQHWKPEPYRVWKRGLVVAALAQAGIDCDVGNLVDAHGAGRRRVVFHARRNDSGDLVVGFTEPGSHAIVPIGHCPVLAHSLDGALNAARAIAEALAATGKPLDIQITAADNGLDVDVRGSGPLDAARLAALSALAERHRLTRLTRHRELVVMRAPPVVTIGKATITLPPGSFTQPTAAGEDALASLVASHAKKTKHIADLFCGIGPFALRLAEKSKVSAFDSDEAAINALAKAAQNTQGLKPLTAAMRDLFRRPMVAQELREFDAVVFDPPRQGAQAQSEQLAKSKVPLVIAVSCNAATFARDARILIDGGYEINDVTPVDQFRHTPHVEIVAAFRRK